MSQRKIVVIMAQNNNRRRNISYGNDSRYWDSVFYYTSGETETLRVIEASVVYTHDIPKISDKINTEQHNKNLTLHRYTDISGGVL